jgi:hypothetical protein
LDRPMNANSGNAQRRLVASDGALFSNSADLIFMPHSPNDSPAHFKPRAHPAHSTQSVTY